LLSSMKMKKVGGQRFGVQKLRGCNNCQKYVPIDLRVHEKINLQFWELRRPDSKARKLKEYQAYFEFS